MLLAESRAELEKRLLVLIMRLKEKGLMVSIGKTKVMNCKVGVGQVENSPLIWQLNLGLASTT